MPAERALCHPPRDLVFAHDDEIGAVALQVLNLSIGMSARDDLDLRVRRAPLLYNLPSLKPIRDGDQEAPRFSQIGRSDHLRRGGVAPDRFDAASPQFLDQLLSVLDDQERQLLALQLLTHATPDAPETDQDHVILEGLRPPLDYFSAASGLISTVVDLAKYDVAIDRDQVYSPEAKRQVWTPMQSPTGERFPYGFGWFVWELPSRAPMPWHYGYYTDASSALLLKVPDRQLSLILLASSDRASSPFGLGSGDPARSPFVTAFLDAVGRGD